MNFPLRPTRFELAFAYAAIFAVVFVFGAGVVAIARLALGTCPPEQTTKAHP